MGGTEGARGGREGGSDDVRQGRGEEQGEGGREGGKDRVRGGREEARMLHRHEASVEEGRVDDGNKRGRNGARHWRREGGSERSGIARGKDGAREQGNETSREVFLVYSIFTPNPATRSCHCYFVITNEK